MIKDLRAAPPTEADLASAYDVFERSIRDAFAQEGLQHMGEAILEEIEHKKEMLARSIQSDGAVRFLVAKIGDSVIGTISYGPCGKEIRECSQGSLDDLGELGSLYILPEYQGAGAGSFLIEAMVRQLHASGIASFCLDSGYPSAQKKWLKKFGEPCLVVKDYWGSGADHMIWVIQSADHLR